MSNLVKLNNNIMEKRADFEALAKIHGVVNFKREASFALQALERNDYLASVASKNPKSLQNSIINCAAIGISLNPAYRNAYLVPRGREVCLDIGYMGFIYLATEAKSIMWAQAETVKERDEYKYNGVGKAPTHIMNSFGDRGKAIGFYVVVKTMDGDFLTTQMSVDEVNYIRDRSEGYKSYKRALKQGQTKQTPWVDFYEEMAKKTVIKRAAKTWPRTDASDRLFKAIESDNAVNKVDLSSEPYIETSAEVVESFSDEIRSLLKELGKEEQSFLGFAKGKLQCEEIESLDDLNENQANILIGELKNFKSLLGSK